MTEIIRQPRARWAALAKAAIVAVGLASAIAPITGDGAVAQKRPATSPPPAAGCGSAGAIGVSRTVEIDTTGGPRYGHQQYKDIDFLQDGEIVLTFDDGPLRPYTVPVLKALEAHCTKATFFVVGRMAAADPELVRDTARRGHTIGTHTFSHADARRIGPARARAEAELGISTVSRALGRPVAPFFRFPYLSAPDTTANYLRGRGIGVFSIDADAYDYRSKDPGAVHRAIVSQLTVKRKGILLFHDIQPSTAGAMMGLLSDLQSRGFRVVHMVPKSQTATLAEFDGLADKEMKRRGSANPLANRSIVLGADPPGRGGQTPGGEVLPWGTVAGKPQQAQQPSAAAQPPPVRAAPPPRTRYVPPVVDDNWALRVFE